MGLIYGSGSGRRINLRKYVRRCRSKRDVKAKNRWKGQAGVGGPASRNWRGSEIRQEILDIRRGGSLRTDMLSLEISILLTTTDGEDHIDHARYKKEGRRRGRRKRAEDLKRYIQDYACAKPHKGAQGEKDFQQRIRSHSRGGGGVRLSEIKKEKEALSEGPKIKRAGERRKIKEIGD